MGTRRFHSAEPAQLSLLIEAQVQMKEAFRFLVAGCICISMLAGGRAAAQQRFWQGNSPEERVSREVFRLVNQYRASRGLRALQPKRELNAIAMQHSRDMASGRLPFSHQGFNERVAAVRRYAKIPYKVAENLYANTSGHNIALLALKGWLASPGHRKNIEGNFLFTGIAVARSASGEFFITQLFVGKKE